MWSYTTPPQHYVAEMVVHPVHDAACSVQPQLCAAGRDLRVLEDNLQVVCPDFQMGFDDIVFLPHNPVRSHHVSCMSLLAR